MTLRIIHLEDNPLDADLVQAHLQEAGIDSHVIRVDSAPAYLEALAQPADLILADYSLPQYSGNEALEEAQRLQPDTPFIFVTGALGEERAIDLLKAGATDYVLKERLGRLIPAVERALRERRDHLERLRAEADLRQSEERLRMAQQAAGAGVWDVDLITSERTWSVEQHRIWGVDPLASPPTYDDLLALIHEEDRQRADEEIQDALDCQRGIDVQFRIRHAQKGIRWLHVIASAVCDDSGRAVRLTGIALDVTENKQADLKLEQRARELEDLYRVSEAVARAARLEDVYEIAMDSLMNSLGVERSSILLFDEQEDPPVMRFRAWRGLSEEYRARVEGHSPWTADERNPQPLLVDDVQTDERIAAYREIFEREGIRSLAFIPLVYEDRLLGKFMLYRSEPHHWGTDEVRRAQNFANHVAFSLRSRSDQQALKESEARFRALAETIPDIVFVADAQGNREYVNRRFLEFTGTSERGAFSSDWVRIVHPDDRERAMEAWNRSVETGEPFDLTFRMRSAEGQYRWFMGRATSITDAHGKAARWYGTMTDIDALIQVEQDLAYHAAQLARSNADLEDFAYVASHDLKEPLRGISNYANFLLEDYREQLPQDGREKLETLVRLSKRMYELLDHLLEYSRVGRAELALQEVEVEDVVNRALEGLGARLDQEQAEVVVRTPLPRLRCDPMRISQVVGNLVANALKYNDSSIKRVEIGALPPSNGESGPVIYIRDNGIGIPSQHKENIFRMFKRLHARDRYGGGTGAGLAIVKKIIQRHNGRIWVESSPGQGTTFYFTVGARGSQPGAGSGMAAGKGLSLPATRPPLTRREPWAAAR